MIHFSTRTWTGWIVENSGTAASVNHQKVSWIMNYGNSTFGLNLISGFFLKKGDCGFCGSFGLILGIVFENDQPRPTSPRIGRGIFFTFACNKDSLILVIVVPVVTVPVPSAEVDPSCQAASCLTTQRCHHPYQQLWNRRFIKSAFSSF